MRRIIIYKSRTGFTEKYAEWLAELLQCECVPQEDVVLEELSNYDVIVFGSSFRAGNIEEIKWYKEQILSLDKIHVVFVTGAMPSTSTEVARSLEQNFTKQEREDIKIFYLQSGLNYEAMKLPDKLMMKVFRSMIKGKKPRNEEEKNFQEMIQKSFDLCDSANLEPMLNYIQGL